MMKIIFQESNQHCSYQEKEENFQFENYTIFFHFKLEKPYTSFREELKKELKNKQFDNKQKT